METQDIPLASGFTGGINRADAPHLLPPNELVEAYDAALYDDKTGVLGPRRGRVLGDKYASDIMGAATLDVPWGDYSVVALDTGAIICILVGSPPPGTPPSLVDGWVRCDPGTLVANQSGVGTTNGSAYTLYTPTNLANFGAITFNEPTADTFWNAVCDDIYSDTIGVLTLEFEIDSVWTEIMYFHFDHSTDDYYTSYATLPTTGVVTKMRIKNQITAGLGDANGSFSGDIYFVYGTEDSVV